VKRPFAAPFFNEFVLQLEKDAATVLAKLQQQKILAGVALSRWYPDLKNSLRSAPQRPPKRSDLDRVIPLSGGTGMKARSHITQSEALLFEKSAPGKYGYRLPPLDVPAVDASKALGGAHLRTEIEGFPEVSEIEIIRHFTRLSTWNYGVDTGMYPLGSCTMKYNPRVNEVAARLAGLATEHPFQPDDLSQGCLKVMQLLARCLLEITGLDAITLQPAAGAHGELTGVLLHARISNRKATRARSC
jgi:hypothetical protein